MVLDTDYSDGFPSRKIKNWFQTKKQFNKLIEEFQPDAIFIDREKHFGTAALEKNIPAYCTATGALLVRACLVQKNNIQIISKKYCPSEMGSNCKKDFCRGRK